MSSSASRGQMLPQVLVHAVVRCELLVNVGELAARVAEEQPSRDDVVEGAEIEEHQQRGCADCPAVPAEEQSFVRGEEGQLAGQPCCQQDRVRAARKAMFGIMVGSPQMPDRPGSS